MRCVLSTSRRLVYQSNWTLMIPLENILKTSLQDALTMSWRRLEDVLKTSPEDEDERRLQDVLKTISSRRMFAGLYTENRNVKYLLCVIDVFTKYAWLKSFKEKTIKTVLKAFIEIVNESNCGLIKEKNSIRD